MDSEPTNSEPTNSEIDQRFREVVSHMERGS
jgi:hypothetical protein